MNTYGTLEEVREYLTLASQDGAAVFAFFIASLIFA